MEIKGPKNAPAHPARSIDCEFAIKPTYQENIASAMIAGWSEIEAAEALLELARNHIAGLLADEETDMDIEAAAHTVM